MAPKKAELILYFEVKAYKNCTLEIANKVLWIL